jgi:hypothetical protein
MVRLTTLIIKTKKMGAMLAFYKAIGMSMQVEKHGSEVAYGVGELVGMALELYLTHQDGPVEAQPTLHFEVDDFEETIERLSALDCSKGDREARLLDPEGRLVIIERA